MRTGRDQRLEASSWSARIVQQFSGDPVSGAASSALAVLLLTSVHHAYGAFVYATPWRYHAVLFSGATALVILGSLALLRARPSGVPATLGRGVFVLTILAVPVLGIGAFEGFYNHVVKIILYFGGGSTTLMDRLFPAPRYEMPNDVFFEITGVLQVIPAVLAAWHLYGMLRRRALRTPPARRGRGPTRRMDRYVAPATQR